MSLFCNPENVDDSGESETIEVAVTDARGRSDRQRAELLRLPLRAGEGSALHRHRAARAGQRWLRPDRTQLGLFHLARVWLGQLPPAKFLFRWRKRLVARLGLCRRNDQGTQP